MRRKRQLLMGLGIGCWCRDTDEMGQENRWMI
jgi:hypothetical protein